MEERIPDADPAEIGNKPDHEQKCAREFKDQRPDENTLDERLDARKAAFPHRLRHSGALIKSEAPPADRHEQNGDKRGKAEPADLNEKKNDDLSERIPMHSRDNGRQSRDAGGGCGSEQRIDERRPCPVCRRDGKRQEKPADEDDEKIPHGKGLPDTHPPFDFYLHEFLLCRALSFRAPTVKSYHKHRAMSTVFYPFPSPAPLMQENPCPHKDSLVFKSP